MPLALDLARTEEIAERLKSLPAQFADVDILVNNAGITADNLLLRMSLEQWSSVLSTNLTGAFVVTKELMRGMMTRRYGRVDHGLVGGGRDGQRGPGQLRGRQGRADRVHQVGRQASSPVAA